mgnify:CR=1 FL=1
MYYELMLAETKRYVMKALRAPSKYTKIFQTKVATKFDCRREYVDNMKILLEVATQAGETKAINYAQGVMDEQTAELEALLSDIKKTNSK